ncbi:uncharacterized protein LOC101852481 [Aplysia californica]|uniref:Large ribosomal subunit protein uL30m n=1 Tax=Aplysia californica TaxID=6500 RepID=A0ABM0JRT9_APLCA|nr:uncharacterized protein LOC101852481 [Aplysia californica]
MAASLVAKKLFSLLKTQTPVQVISVRTAKRGIRNKRRRPVQSWFDPADKSWAEPILKHQQAKASQPEPEPSMLHMVYRVKDHYTRPYWEKDVLKELELFDKAYNPVVLKNTPEMNEKLSQIKHLIRIKPVTFPYGLPKEESDYKHCYLTENGEFIVKHKIDDQSTEVEQAWAEVKLVEERGESEDIWRMDHATIRKECNRVLQLYNLNQEYFPEQYIYRHNQDGKEDRYKGNQDIGNRRHDWY